MKLGEAMYKAQQAEEGAAEAANGDAAGAARDDDVVDADFEEVDDDDDRRSLPDAGDGRGSLPPLSGRGRHVC
jgi:hypothetical protein